MACRHQKYAKSAPPGVQLHQDDRQKQEICHLVGARQDRVEDPTVGERIYSPGHPDADANGYIRSSNVNAMVDMADAIMAQRAYEANLALINISRSMAAKAAEIGR